MLKIAENSVILGSALGGVWLILCFGKLKNLILAVLLGAQPIKACFASALGGVLTVLMGALASAVGGELFIYKDARSFIFL